MSSEKYDMDSMKDELKWVSYTEKPEKLGGGRALAKLSSNPFIPIGALVTTGILGYGFYNVLTGNKRKQQLLMRCRCLAQGVTITLVFFSLFSGRKAE